MTPQRLAAWAALCVLALVAGPVGSAPAAQPVVTIANPAGPVVVDGDQLAHWSAIARRSGQGLNAREIDEQVLAFLVSSQWIVGEAQGRGVLPSDADVAEMFRQQRAAAFPKEAAYQRFLKESGYAEADLLFRIRVQEASNRVRDNVLGPVTVTADAVTAFLRKHPQRVDEHRDLVLLATRSRAAALRALGALQAGRTFRSVARRSSVHPSRRHGGVLAGQVFYDFGHRLAKRIFSARRGTVVGPVHAGKRWYLFRVLRIHPEHPMAPGQARLRGRQLVLAQAQRRALDAFVKEFQTTWRGRTTCAPAYTWLAEYCGNAAGR